MSIRTQRRRDELQSRRPERVKAFASLRIDARNNFFDRLRKLNKAIDTRVLVELGPTVSIEAGPEPWADVQVDGITRTLNEIQELLQADSSSRIKLLQRAIAAITQNQNTYLVFSIQECPELLQSLAYLLKAEDISNSSFSLALELSVLLASSRDEVKVAMIDQGVVASMVELASRLELIQDPAIVCRVLFFFASIASGAADIFRTLCINHGLPKRCLELFDFLLGTGQCNEDIIDIAKLLSALLALLVKSPFEWDEHLLLFSGTWIRAMNSFAPVDSSISSSLAFALADIANFVDTMAMHRLVPVFMEHGLLQAIVECQYPESETVSIMTINRLFCTTDELVLKYLLSNRSLMDCVRNGVTSSKSDVRTYGFNALANICAVKDSAVHDFLYNDDCHFFSKLLAVIHLDIANVKRFALTAIGNILNFGSESHRDWFCNQPVFLEDLLSNMSSTDKKLLSEIFDIIELLLGHVGDNHKNLVWVMFKRFDLEGKLNNAMMEHQNIMSSAAERILMDYFDYEPVNDEDEDLLDIEFEVSSRGEPDSVVFNFAGNSTNKPVGQTSITSWLTSTSGRMYARDCVDRDVNWVM